MNEEQQVTINVSEKASLELLCPERKESILITYVVPGWFLIVKTGHDQKGDVQYVPIRLALSSWKGLLLQTVEKWLAHIGAIYDQGVGDA